MVYILDDEALRVAVVGMGKMGLLHAGLLNVLPGARLVAVCEKNKLMRRFLARMLRNVHVVDDVYALEDMDLDAVYVTTPIYAHYAVAHAVAGQKLARHMFVEKPLTACYSDSRRLSEEAHVLGGVNMVGYLRRFMVTFMHAKKLLDRDAVGRVEAFKVEAYSSDFHDVAGKAVKANSGVLAELGSYAVDVARWYFGDFIVESAFVESRLNMGVEDAASFRLKSVKHQLTGEFQVSWCVPGYRLPQVTVKIKGSRGTLEVDDDEVRVEKQDGEAKVWYRPDLHDTVDYWLGAPEYCREDAYFLHAAKTGETATPNFDEAAEVDKLLEEIRHKAREPS